MVRLKIRLDPNYQKLAWFPMVSPVSPAKKIYTTSSHFPFGWDVPPRQDAKMWITPNATAGGAGAGCGARSTGEEIAVEEVHCS